MKQLTITIFIIIIAITQNTLAEKVYSLVPHLNIRKSADIKSPVIGKLQKGVWAQKMGCKEIPRGCQVLPLRQAAVHLLDQKGCCLRRSCKGAAAEARVDFLPVFVWRPYLSG